MGRKFEVTITEIGGVAGKIARLLKGGEILALVGPLGAGKTTFTQVLAKKLKVKAKVTSPTFIILRDYFGKLGNKPLYIYHLDLYRTKNFKEVKALGVTEVWGKPRTLTVIEWADKINNHLPDKTWVINFKS